MNGYEMMIKLQNLDAVRCDRERSSRKSNPRIRLFSWM